MATLTWLGHAAFRIDTDAGKRIYVDPFLQNNPKTPDDKKCVCHRTCEWNPNTRQVEEKEDPKCRSWCFRDHCTCLSECDSH